MDVKEDKAKPCSGDKVISIQPPPNITDSISLDDDYKSVTERYFSKRYSLNVGKLKNNDHLLLFHSNKICVITLAPSHPVFLEESFTINYDVGKQDRTKNSVKGKGKKGGQSLHVNSALCKIQCKSGKEFTVSSCIKGKLIEVNEALITNPELLKLYPDSNGFIAVVLSYITASAFRKDELLTQEEYEQEITSNVASVI